MKNVKINLDRPQVDSKSIQAHKDFNGLMKNHALMSKPFYKSPWFLGTVGLASVSIIVGGIVTYNANEEVANEVRLDTEAPPELTTGNHQIIAFNTENPEENFQQILENDNRTKETFDYSSKDQNKTDDKTPTLENQDKSESNQLEIDQNQVISEQPELNLSSHTTKHEEVKEEINYTSLLPRISGKFDGSISREELFDNKGITTESDISIIHFELHLIDGLGGDVMEFEEESNQLTEEMKAALKKINKGEIIYFENIKGQTQKGDVVRLNPLRYVLMN